MSTENMKRLESGNHFPVKEYRISDDGKIEARILDCGSERESDWTEVSPEQLSAHIQRNTAVARWLERNLGWRRSLRACVGLEPTKLTESATIRLPDSGHSKNGKGQGVRLHQVI